MCRHLEGVCVVARVAKKVREERQTEISVKGPFSFGKGLMLVDFTQSS